ncbi:MFS transporter [Alicyclobacillus acidoterrestris]|uniref:Uncharacterized protein n=1 Tax=Alicyclobacillus acidoterrestris (strain ATCC 49025 / DSM 3922 / CIP 106132 / NCIMB 13137 / GD3B) TaxID=1356854 RepID=T0BIY2_ALIAG|nr:MFS transporter [Alicyclobacillus acidoterrestris]EPZ40679.1 hypothetical protein N007_17830 [Alicyclobacillus acidoterrestris ATCC 49025]UNO50472.1 hypothetical protein K1I37_08415 [Alicyclobacillus acidoterrestris]
MVEGKSSNLSSHPTVRRLQQAALLRNVCQGIAAVDVSLYLQSLGWHGLAIGGVLAASGVVRSILTVFAGELQQLLGSKRYILVYELLACIAALVLAITTNALAMCFAIGIAGFGRGHSGSGGPIAPIERAWLGAYARRSDERSAHAIFGVHAAVGYVGMGVGALIAGLPSLLKLWVPSTESYHIVFALTTLTSLFCAWTIARVSGGQRKPRTRTNAESKRANTTDKEGREPATEASLTEWMGLLQIIGLVAIVSLLTWHWQTWFPKLSTLRPLIPVAMVVVIMGGKWTVDNLSSRHRSTAKFASQAPTRLGSPLVNLVNSVAVTLSITMTSFWLSVRFHASEYVIGVVVAASYFAAGGVALLNVRIANRFGAIRTMVYLQIIGSITVFALPLVPWLWTAACLNLFAVGLNLGSRGSRSMVMATGHKRLRSWQRKVSTIVILTLTTGAWPAAFGQMMEEEEFVLPFFLAGSAQLLSTVWFRNRYTQESTP